MQLARGQLRDACLPQNQARQAIFGAEHMDASNLSIFRIFRHKASRYAFVGTVIASIAVIVATLLLCMLVYDGINLTNVVRAHRENVPLWILDAMPFVYAFWGQYASTRMAREARSLVHDRTRALRAELEEAHYTTRTKTDFFARMSHELRTPINAILGMSETLIDAGLDDRHQRNAQIIHESAEGLLNLINDVLDFSKIEAGRMEMDSVEFDIQETLNGTTTLLARQADAKGLRLVRLVPPHAPRKVIGDPGRLRQVLLNLLSNAIKYTEEGEVILSLKNWRHETRDTVRFEIEVTDTGIGIPKAEQERLFQPYAQSRTSGLKRRDSTGLGLSIARELVEAMGGTIQVASEPGNGSAFSFDLVLKAAATQADTISMPTSPRGTRVVLVESPSVGRDTLSDQLRTLGMKLQVVDNGAAALAEVRRAAVQGTPIDLLLTDIFLPDMSGEELGEKLKSQPETRGTCLAIVTSTGARGDAKRFNDAQFAGYLTRPIPPEHLQELLARILATREMSEKDRHRHGPVTKYHAQDDKIKAEAPLLLVDDSEIALEISYSMLERLGWKADTASTAREALKKMAQKEYGMVITDQRLPDMNGDALIRRIRQEEGTPGQIPIIVLTAGGSSKQQCLDAGANDWLIKPVALDVLRNTLDRHSPERPTASANVDRERESEGSPEFIDPRLKEIFLKESRRRLQEMRATMENESPDCEVLARNAHSLKGSSRHVGGGHVPIIAHRLEVAAQSGDNSGIRKNFSELERACEKLWQRLQGDSRDSAYSS